MNDLPELPFEKVLSYLSLEDRLKSRAVSRAWCNKIDSLRVKSLCYSNHPSWFIRAKNRLVSGIFAQNFIGSLRFALFFDTFGQTILCNLKHLRLCCYRLNEENRPSFAPTLQSFAQLEELALFRLNYSDDSKSGTKLELNLPMLNRIHMEYLGGIQMLILDAPRLKKVKLEDCFSMRLHFVRGETVETLITDHLEYIEVEKLKNLRYLYNSDKPRGNSTFLASLERLEEIHLQVRENVLYLFEQKRQYGRLDLKIFLGGLLLSGPKDPNRFNCSNEFNYLAENHAKLADEMPFCSWLGYMGIERVPAELAIDVLKRFTALNEIRISGPVRDIPRFFDFLKHLDTVVELGFWCDQPQDLFDRLPEHFAAQRLTICCSLSDFQFLFRLKKLVCLSVQWPIDLECVRKVLEELEFLSQFKFCYDMDCEIQIDHPKRLRLLVGESREIFRDLNSVIEFIEYFRFKMFT